MKQLLYDVLIVIMLFSSATVSAKTLNLYSEPKTDSKIVGNLNTETGVTLVYTPKTGEWIKVANPNNGEVGWVKSSDLGENTYNMRVFTSKNGTYSYNVYQFGTGNSQIEQKQLESKMRHFEQQRMMQMHMAHLFNDMFYFPQPIFVPVVVMHEQPKLQKAAHQSDSNKKANLNNTIEKS